MPQPFVGEIRIFAGNFEPAGWAFCDGTLLPISDYFTLWNLIGTTYGGDGVNTFALPDLRGRFPVHQGFDANGAGYVMGQFGGQESVTLTESQLPSHTHTAKGVKAGTTSSPVGAIWAGAPTPAYSSVASNVSMSSAAVSSVGSNQPHENRSPYLGTTFIISLFGIYPSPD
jgi:microcystin-dependent protein